MSSKLAWTGNIRFDLSCGLLRVHSPRLVGSVTVFRSRAAHIPLAVGALEVLEHNTRLVAVIPIFPRLLITFADPS